jgi:hypothetical protein
MRKIVVFVLAVAMVLGGLCLVGVELFFSRIAYARFIIGGIMLISVGACLLWADFLAPTLGIRTWEDYDEVEQRRAYLKRLRIMRSVST